MKEIEPEDCTEDCEYRWGNNCAAHWRDENAPRRVKSDSELRAILRKYQDAKLEIFDTGKIDGEEYDLWLTNSIAIQIKPSRGGAELVILSRELFNRITRQHCAKHVGRWAPLAKCTCGTLR